MIIVKFCTLFVASPSDVEERRLIPKLVNDWNSIYSDQYKVGFTTQMWEVNVSAQFSGRPQELINTQLLYRSDLAIVLFWNKYGAPTGKADSGTYEELTKAIEKKIRTGLMFCQKPISPNSMDVDGQKKIKELKTQIQTQAFVEGGVYHDYSNEYEFKDYFHRFLSDYADKISSAGNGNGGNSDNGNDDDNNDTPPDQPSTPGSVVVTTPTRDLNLNASQNEAKVENKILSTDVNSQKSDKEKLDELLKVLNSKTEAYNKLMSVRYEEPFDGAPYSTLATVLDLNIRFKNYELEKTRRSLFTSITKLLDTVAKETFPARSINNEDLQEIPKELLDKNPDYHFRLLQTLVLNTKIVISSVRQLERYKSAEEFL